MRRQRTIPPHLHCSKHWKNSLVFILNPRRSPCKRWLWTMSRCPRRTNFRSARMCGDDCSNANPVLKCCSQTGNHGRGAMFHGNRRNRAWQGTGRRIARAVCLLVTCAVVTASARAQASDYHGQVLFGGLPVPGATVQLTQGETQLATVTDTQGFYQFTHVVDGTWKVHIEMARLCAPGRGSGHRARHTAGCLGAEAALA